MMRKVLGGKGLDENNSDEYKNRFIIICSS
jgi:hypothetical protein